MSPLPRPLYQGSNVFPVDIKHFPSPEQEMRDNSAVIRHKQEAAGAFTLPVTGLAIRLINALDLPAGHSGAMEAHERVQCALGSWDGSRRHCHSDSCGEAAQTGATSADPP